MNIYVGNLALEMTAEELRREFGIYGNVKSVSIMNDKYIGSGQMRGYGYVEMASKSEGEIAVANLSGKRLHGRPISVVEALPLTGNKEKEPSHSGRSTRFSGKRRERSN